ncbi:MAG: hypothetical protein ACJ79S_16785 [Gemmatimonadaceae bacterium]
MIQIRRSRLGTASVVVATILSTACHTYVPAPDGSVAPGAVVLVRLTDRGAADVTSSVGPYARTIEGRLNSLTDSAVVVSVNEVTRANGGEETWRGETVSVQRNGVAELAVPKVSRSRSALLAGGLLAGIVALGVAFGGAGSSVGGRGGNGGTGGTK